MPYINYIIYIFYIYIYMMFMIVEVEVVCYAAVTFYGLFDALTLFASD
jgi:hypothetical protein